MVSQRQKKLKSNQKIRSPPTERALETTPPEAAKLSDRQ
jgi:hypothetical protein